MEAFEELLKRWQKASCRGRGREVVGCSERQFHRHGRSTRQAPELRLDQDEAAGGGLGAADGAGRLMCCENPTPLTAELLLENGNAREKTAPQDLCNGIVRV